MAASTLSAKRRALERRLGVILSAPSRCELTRALQAKIARARDQLLVFLDHHGTVEVTNNGCERLLCPAVVQRKMTNGYRAMWAATGEADIRTGVDTARLDGASPFATILNTVGALTPPSQAWIVTLWPQGLVCPHCGSKKRLAAPLLACRPSVFPELRL